MNHPLIRWLLDLERIPAQAEGVRLAWERPFPAWVWMLLLIAAVLFAFWSYSRLVGDNRGRSILAVIRTAMIAIVLVIISGPMLQLPREIVEEDWVLVLADRSESMQVADAPGEAAALARISRDEQMRRLIDETAATWRELDRDRTVVWLGFHGGAFDLNSGIATRQSGIANADSRIPIREEQPDETQDELEAGERQVSPPVVDLGEAQGRRTMLNTALEQALQKAAARPISGVVVFSDGRTPDPPLRALLRRLEQEQIQVHVVPLGSDEPLGDLAVRRVDAPRRAFIRDKVPVVVEIDRFGEAVTRLGATVRLVDEDTGRVLDETELAAGTDTREVTLTAQPDLAGDANWRIEIESRDGDLIPENNRRTFAIELVDRPLRVLYVEGYPRWEFRYLRWMLIREKSIESSIMLLSADRDFAQEGNTPITRMPRSPEEFAQFDVIILGDVPGTFFSPSQLEMIRDHIGERGAGLLWMAGERWTPSSFIGTAGALADLLPIRGSLALPPIDEPVNMVPTALADRLGVLRLISGEQEGWPRELADPEFGWSRLWWAQRLDPAQLKPTAQPLAVTRSEISGSQLPLVVHMRYGAGQTIYVATDEIWRWRYGRGDYLPEQFWLQMIRMLGRETLAGGDAPAVLEAEPRRIAVNQPVRITLRLLDARLAGLDLAAVRATLEDAQGAVLGEIELHSTGEGAGEYGSTILPGAVGPLRVRVTDPLIAQTPLLEEIEVFSEEDELRRPETDHDLLAALAAETGGRVLDDEAGIRQLPTILPNRSVSTPNPLTERIWDTPLAFILVLLLLTGEWIGRKFLRLA